MALSYLTIFDELVIVFFLIIFNQRDGIQRANFDPTRPNNLFLASIFVIIYFLFIIIIIIFF
jgi:hypothetical protein